MKSDSWYEAEKKSVSQLADFCFPPYLGIFDISGLFAARFVSLKSEVKEFYLHKRDLE